MRNDGMKIALIASFALLTLGFGGCSRAPQAETADSAKEKVFQVRGLLRTINFAAQTISIEHEDIPNYMPSMTMPFDVKTMAEVEPLRVGDAIAFRLIVKDETSWIEDVKKIAPGDLRLPVATAQSSLPDGTIERLKEGDRLPDFALVDAQNRKIGSATFAGKPLLLTFIFTRCPLPNFCPLLSRNFKQLEKEIQQDPVLAGRVQLLSISFDPDFDTPEVLAHYGKSFTKDNERWRFATGTKAEIEKLTHAFSVYVKAEDGSINHGLCTALVDSSGTIKKIWRGNAWKISEVLAELKDVGASPPKTAF